MANSFIIVHPQMRNLNITQSPGCCKNSKILRFNSKNNVVETLKQSCRKWLVVIFIQDFFFNSFENKLPSVQFSSVAQSCPTLCDPMNCSSPGLPVHHQLPEFTQTHIHRVRDAIQPSHPLSSPSSPAPNPSQHQSLFQ